MKKYKILCIAPQNPFPYTDGGKIGIFFPIKYLAKYSELYFSCPVQAFTNEDIGNYKKYDINFYPYKLNTNDNYWLYATSLFTRRSYKLNKYYDKKYLEYLKKIVKKNSIEILWINSLHMAVYALKLKKQYPNLKIYLREHNIEYELVKQYSQSCNNIFMKLISYFEYLKTKKYETKIWTKFDKVYFISDSDLTIAKKYGKYSTENLIYDGVEIEDNMNENYEEKSFIFTGSLSSFQNRQNLKNFIENIWKNFIVKYPENKLYLTGNSDSSLEKNLKISIDELNKLNIFNLGFVDDIKKTIRSKKYVISPTMYGSGIRLKVLEALGLKKTIFVLDTDYKMCKYFNDMENIIHYTSIKDFTQKFNLLEKHYELYTKITENAYQLSKKIFSWGNYTKKLLEEFDT